MPVYIIRASADRPLLNVELSGVVSTEEALQAITRARALAEAGRARVIRCDLHTLEAGPDCRPLVAAALAANLGPLFTVAFVGQAEKLRVLQPLLRRVAPGRVRCFESDAAAGAFIGQACGLRRSLPATAQRHVNDVFGAGASPPDPSAAASRRATA